MKQLGGKVNVLGVAWAGQDAEMVAFEQRHGLTFPSLRDDDGTLFARYGVPVQPAWVFIDKAGHVDTSIGALERPELEQRLQALASA